MITPKAYKHSLRTLTQKELAICVADLGAYWVVARQLYSERQSGLTDAERRYCRMEGIKIRDFRKRKRQKK